MTDIAHLGDLCTSAEAEPFLVERQLHDIVVPQLFMLTTGLTALHRQAEAGENDAQLVETLLHTATRALADLRTISRSQVVQEGGPITEVLNRLDEETAEFSRFSACAVVVELVGDDVEIAPSVADDLVAFAWEALINAVRHGRATHVTLRVVIADEMLRMVAEDNGRWRAADGTGTGLRGLGDRAARWGGDVSVDASKRGTTVEWRVPRLRVDLGRSGR